ncbi:MAG: rod-binding protein [Calditrichia bacterium]
MKIDNSLPIINTLQIRNTGEQGRSKEAGEKLESVFIAMLVKAMEKTLPGGSFAGSSSGLAGMMFANTLADAIASQGGLGFADSVAESMNLNNVETLNELEVPATMRALRQLNGNMP